MEKVKGCYYCEQNPDFQRLLFKTCNLKVSTVFLCRDQTLPGRCTIMFKDHYKEIFEIPKTERDEFIDDVCALAKTIQTLFNPDKINYAIYGDEVNHVHFNLCPKYKGKLGWSKPFVLFPEEKDLVILTKEEYAERMALIAKTARQIRGLE